MQLQYRTFVKSELVAHNVQHSIFIRDKYIQFTHIHVYMTTTKSIDVKVICRFNWE